MGQEVSVQYNLCNEPWLKYTLPAIADREKFTQAAAIRGPNSFVDADQQFEFDKAMYAVTAYW